MRLATGPSAAHAATKRIVRAYLDGGVSAADAVLPQIAAELVRTEDHRAAVAAFLTDGPEHRTTYLGR
jgi:enoyl-CoA hydratase/carnithine racemase